MTSKGGTNTINAYCLFCRTGAEHLVVQSINQSYPGLTVIAPVKILPEKRRGQWENREQILLPSYVFLYTELELPVDLQQKSHHLFKILQYEQGIRALTGSDADYADWVYRHHGQIEPSKVLAEGKTILVIAGPLLDCQGTIIKLDKHKRRALVEFTFDGQKRVVSLGAECVSTNEAK